MFVSKQVFKHVFKQVVVFTEAPVCCDGLSGRVHASVSAELFGTQLVGRKDTGPIGNVTLCRSMRCIWRCKTIRGRANTKANRSMKAGPGLQPIRGRSK